MPAGYPGPLDLKPLRGRADELWARLKDRAVAFWSVAVDTGEEFQGWSFCEKVCELSVREASRDLQRAKALARLAVKIAGTGDRAGLVAEPGARLRAAHLANILRVAGHLKAADALLEKAKKLWEAGADPTGCSIRDGCSSLEAALRRDQRQFDRTLALLEQAVQVSRYPERAMIMKGFTLEVMGEYEQAIGALLEASRWSSVGRCSTLGTSSRLNLANSSSIVVATPKPRV